MAKRTKKVEGIEHSVKPKRPYTRKTIQGLGDVVEAITEATGIKSIVETITEATGTDCGCTENKFLLNRLFPFKRVSKCMTEQHKEQFKLFLDDCGTRVLENRITDITNHVQFLNDLYHEYFAIKIDICENCSGIHKAIIKDLNKLYLNS